MSVRNDLKDSVVRELQILAGLDTLEKSINFTRSKADNLQGALNFVSIPALSESVIDKKESVSIAPEMSECARKLWELNSYVYYTNRILDDILSRLDL